MFGSAFGGEVWFGARGIEKKEVTHLVRFSMASPPTQEFPLLQSCYGWLGLHLISHVWASRGSGKICWPAGSGTRPLCRFTAFSVCYNGVFMPALLLISPCDGFCPFSRGECGSFPCFLNSGSFTLSSRNGLFPRPQSGMLWPERALLHAEIIGLSPLTICVPAERFWISSTSDLWKNFPLGLIYQLSNKSISPPNVAAN